VNSLVTSNNGTDEVIVLGDFNERLDDSEGGLDNWAPFLNESRYVVRSRPLENAGEASFLSSANALIDHIVTTRAFDDEVGAGTAGVAKLEQDILNYRDQISDHRPVTLIMRGVP
jgi:endonuclease/exonuclease/phosphatase family metal-dependent hydrolase